LSLEQSLPMNYRRGLNGGGSGRATRQFVQDLCQSDASAATILADLPISVLQEGSLSVLVAHEGRGLLPGLKERVPGR
jgi:hypothetical protein